MIITILNNFYELFGIYHNLGNNHYEYSNWFIEKLTNIIEILMCCFMLFIQYYIIKFIIKIFI